MRVARRRFTPVVIAVSALVAPGPSTSHARASESADDPAASISEVLGRSESPGPGAESRDRIVATLAENFSWTDLAVAWNRSGDPAHAELLLAAIAAQSDAKRAEFFGIAAQPGVKRFLRNAAFGVVRVSPGSARMDRIMALTAAIPEHERGSPFSIGPLRDAVAARLAHAPGDIEPLNVAWTGLDPMIREVFFDGIESAGRRCGSATLSEILVSVRPIDAASVARLANLPVRSASPWAQGTDDIVRSALASDDPVMRRCGARLAARLGGATHVASLVALLDDSESAADAQAALRAALGVDLMADAEIWSARIASDERWFSKSWQAEREAFADVAHPESILAAIDRVSERLLHADQIAPALEPLARSGTTEVRVAAMRVLGRFRRPAAIAFLASAADEQDARIANAASDALAAITGLPAPARPAGWRELLAL